MRVAVHQADGTVFAYKVGNVIDGSHNVDLLSGEVTPVEKIVEGLVTQAKAEYPEHRVVVEDLVDGQWVDPKDQDSPPVFDPTPTSIVSSVSLPLGPPVNHNED